MRVAHLLTSIFNMGNSCENHGLIEISGVVNGRIHKGNSVVISPSGRFYGEVEARNLEIAGMVQGDVEAETLVVHSSGQLYYDRLSCKHLSAEDGSTLVYRGVSERLNDAVEEESPGNTSSTDNIRGTTDENPCENAVDSNAGLSGDVPRASREYSRDYGVQEVMPSPAKRHALHVDRQEPLPNDRQPHFYTSY